MSAQRQTPFQTIEQACKTTGLSMYYLRRGCWAGTVPHIKSGRVYYISSASFFSHSASVFA